MTKTPAMGASPEATTTPLILDFLEWLAAEPRPYAEVMDVWRTSCPRLTIWEDAVERGLVARECGPSRAVVLTDAGRGLLKASGRHGLAAA